MAHRLHYQGNMNATIKTATYLPGAQIQLGYAIRAKGNGYGHTFAFATRTYRVANDSAALPRTVR